MTKSTEIVRLAQDIVNYQKQRRWSDAAMLRAFPDLGSTKTYKRIIAGDVSELNIEKQLTNYTSVWNTIKGLAGDADPDEELYEELYAPTKLAEAFLDIHEITSLDRVIILQGPTASGKSAACRLLMREWKSRLRTVEASVVWADRPATMLGAILNVLGHNEISHWADDRYNLLVTILRAKRIGIIIEEAHHLGPRCLNLLKSLTNNTPGEFILSCIDSLWRKLESATFAYEEARQISSNRMHARIVLGKDVRFDDAKVILARRLHLSKEDADSAAAKLVPLCNTHGRLAFLRGVCNRAAALADDAESAVTSEILEKAIRVETLNR